jgi:hypothetical protein
MSATTNEQQQQQAPTAELFEFIIGGATYRYTSHQQSLTMTTGGFFYSAVPIKRGEFEIGTNAIKADTTIVINISGTVFGTLQNTNNLPIRVIIRKCLVADIDDNYKVFDGQVRKLYYHYQEATLECSGGGYHLDRIIPTVHVQQHCNNILFDTRCGLNKNDYEIQAIVTGINYDYGIEYGFGGYLELQNYIPDSFGNNLSDYDNGYYNGGTIKKNDEYVKIILCDFPGFRILYRPEIYTGDIVSVFPGCNKGPFTCSNTFDNLTNFIGFPYLPSLSPADWGIQNSST